VAARSGRDNGLPPAAAYDALVDVDPPVADRVLMLLYGAGIAAYAEPIVGERGPYQNVQPPPRPTERVHVDRAQRGSAEEVVGAQLPTLRAEFHAAAALSVDRDAMAQRQTERDDSAWEALVAGFDRPLDADRPAPWPGSEDLDEGRGESPGEGGAAGASPDAPVTPPPETEVGLSSRLIRRSSSTPDPSEHSEDVFDAEDEHYEPPPPPPLPETEPITRFAWAGVVGGPAVLVLNAMLGWPIGTWIGGLSVLAFIGGFVTLVARMTDRNPNDDGWDDGAVL